MRKQPSSTKIKGTNAVVGEPEVEPAARVIKPVQRRETATRRVKNVASSGIRRGSDSAASTGVAAKDARVG